MAHPKINEFLAALTHNLKKSKNRDATLEEISSHILDAIEHLQTKGLTEDEAIKSAITRLGDPKKLGHALRAAQRPWYFRWFVVLPSISALFLVACVGTLCFLANQYLQNAEELMRSKHEVFSLFLADQESVQKYAFLRNYGQRHDAGEFLNHRIRWQGSDIAEKYLHPQISLSDKDQKLLQQKNWLRLESHRELDQIDLSWMSELAKYDYWDVFASDGAAYDHIQRQVPWVKAAIPNYISLIGLVKIRYLRALREKNPLLALKEVRHFLVLIQSNEILLASMIAVKMLRLEAEFYHEAVNRHLMQANEWTAISEKDAAVLKRVMYSTAEWVDIVTPSEMFAVMEAKAATLTGFCTALAEAENVRFLIKRYLEPQIWPEPDLRPNFERLRKLAETNRGRCRLTYSQMAQFENKLDPGSPYLTGNKLHDLFLRLYYPVVSHIPYLRRWEGAYLASVARPNWAFQYLPMVWENQSKSATRFPAQAKPESR